MSRLLALGLVLVVGLAGCIQPPNDPSDAIDQPPEARGGGTMTAEETRADDATLCTSNLGLEADERFCATRVVTVTGSLSGFSSLDVALETFNGDVSVSEGSDGRWGFVATLKARGASADEAMARLDAIDFRWQHEEGSGHFVQVVAEQSGDARGEAVSIALTMPRSLVMRLVAATSNGDVELAGSKTDGLALTTSNGRIVARGEATQVSLTSSNGDIEAELTPAADGRWALTTSNGDVKLVVPEGAEYGYKLEGATSNGEVDYTLRDGEEGPCPQGSEYYTPPCNHRSFETRGFSSRATQVYGALTTSNGEIEAGPR